MAVALFTVSILSLNAAGSAEDPMTEAYELYEMKQYDEVIRRLTVIMETYPERFDEAEALLAKVRAAFGEFNVLYNQLAIKLYEEEDVEEALKIIREMEQIYDNPNELVAKTIRQAKFTAQLVFFRQEYDRIMNSAAEAIADSRYSNAVSIYKEGFYLYQEEYEDAEYANILKDRSTTALADMREAADYLESQLSTNLVVIDRLLSSGLADDPASAQTALNTVLTQLEEGFALSANLKAYAQTLNEINSELEKVSIDGLRDPHLTFMNRFITGRSSASGYEGLLGVIDAALVDRYEDTVALIEQKADSLYTRGRQNVLSEGNTSGINSLISTSRFHRLAITAANTVAERFVDVENEKNTIKNLQEDFLLRRSKLPVLADISLYLSDAMSLRFDLDIQPGNQRESLIANRAAYIEQRSSYQQTLQEWQNYKADISPELLSDSDIAQYIRDIEGLIDVDIAALNREEFRTFIALMTQDIDPIEETLAQANDTVDEALTNLEGIPYTDALGETQYYYYPLQARTTLGAVSEDLDTLREQLSGYLTEYSGETEFIANQEEYNNLLAQVRLNLNQVENQINVVASRFTEADNRVRESESFKSNAYRNIESARTNLGLEKFDEAYSELNNATTNFVESLKIQEDPELRDQIDTLIANVSGEIAAQERVVVLRVVRSQIRDAKNNYSASLFNEARDRLLRAQDAYNRVFSDENIEIKLWLGYVNNALFVEKDQEVAITNPLYSDVTRLLNLAKEDYNKGLTAYNNQNISEANKRFYSALQKINQILKPFPRHKEAGLLRLLALKFSDPTQYRKEFNQKVDAAIDPQKIIGEQQKRDAIVDLKNLLEVEPGNTRVVAEIRRIETELSQANRNVETAAQREAKTLLAQARPLVNRGTYENLLRARDILAVALTRDSNNDEVSNLYYSVTGQINAQVTRALTLDEQSLLNQAQDAFAAGNYFRCDVLLLQLTSDPSRESHPDIKFLRGQLTLLGIGI